MTTRSYGPSADAPRYRLWPVSFRWRRGGCSTFFGRHWIEEVPDQVAPLDGPAWPWRTTLATVFHVGALKIVVGASR